MYPFTVLTPVFTEQTSTGTEYGGNGGWGGRGDERLRRKGCLFRVVEEEMSARATVKGTSAEGRSGP